MRLALAPIWLAFALSAAGCWNSASEFMREPLFSPVGAGLVPEETAGIESARALAVPEPPPLVRRLPCTASRASPMSATSCG